MIPHLGLVCITNSKAVRYRAITRKTLLSLPLHEQEERLSALYRHNLAVLSTAIDYCNANQIKLYRILSQIFPFADTPMGIDILSGLQQELRAVGQRATQSKLRMVMHPDQFVVLNSTSPAVVQNSIENLEMHARILDALEQPQTPWALIEIHGGKGNRAEELIAQIGDLPPNIRARLVLENDEHIYSAAEILAICQAAAVPMVFDAHHHVCHEKLENFDDPSIAEYVEAARTTWPHAEWQVAHISNGRDGFQDRRHSDLITTMPAAYQHIPWIEIEAKHKEVAIQQLQQQWLPGITDDLSATD